MTSQTGLARLALAAFALCVIAPGTSFAQDLNPVAPRPIEDGFTMQAVGTETGSWSSNPLMVTTGAEALYGSITTPELIINRTMPTSTINLDTKLSENLFNLSSFDSTDVHEGDMFSLNNQRWKIGTGLATDYDTTRTSELSNFGLTNVVSRHLGLAASPEISFAPNPTDHFSLAGNVASSTYDKIQFTNYATYSLTPSYLHSFDPNNAGVFSVVTQRYQSLRGPSRRIDSMAPSVAWQATISPRFTFNLGGGAEASREYDLGVATSPWTWHPVFSSGLTFNGEQDTINASAKREQYAYGDGTEALQTTLNIAETHALNANVSLNFGASYIMSSYQVTTGNNIDTLASGSGGATYHITEHLDLTATYQYRHETLTNTSATATDHAVTLALAYRPEQWTVSP